MAVKRWGIWVLVCAVLVRALVAPGFMPTIATDGAGRGYLTMVICTSDGIRTVHVDAEGRVVDAPADPDGDQPTHGGHDLCSFAVTAVLAIPGPDSGFELLRTIGDRSARLLPIVLRPDAPATGPPLGARAPPNLA
ncbi:MAG: DUF2946 family protein [Pseudomonadota bacterium]